MSHLNAGGDAAAGLLRLVSLARLRRLLCWLRLALLGALAATIAGCSFNALDALKPPPPVPLTVHDFGLAPVPQAQSAAVRIRASIAVPDPTGPAWLDSNSIVYRLGHVDGAQPRVYARSRWVGPPSELIGNRLRARVADVARPGLASSRDGVQSDYVLRLELDEFSQVFDGMDASRAVVRARATLISGARRTTVRQRAFSFERPARSHDAAGGAAALAAASHELIEALIDWMDSTLAESPAAAPTGAGATPGSVSRSISGPVSAASAWPAADTRNLQTPPTALPSPKTSQSSQTPQAARTSPTPARKPAPQIAGELP